jgi:3',5'-cyclic AMP phosphodiesterase CpdA
LGRRQPRRILRGDVVRVIVHLSDIHFGRIDSATVQPLRDAIIAVRPDLLAVSGDLTQRARRTEFAQARNFLDSLPFPRLVVPGNHDVPLHNVFTRFATPLARYTHAITRDLAPVHRDDEMIVVGVNTARSWTWGEGRINLAQVQQVVAELEPAPKALIRIVVTHHPFDLPDGVKEKRLVGRAVMAMEKLSAAGADLFLAGHLHISHIGHTAERYNIAGHSSLVVQAGTVSTRSRGEQPSFNVLRVARPMVSVERMVWDVDRGTFEVAAASHFVHRDAGWVPAEA